jgi:hypothetical protein
MRWRVEPNRVKTKIQTLIKQVKIVLAFHSNDGYGTVRTHSSRA